MRIPLRPCTASRRRSVSPSEWSWCSSIQNSRRDTGSTPVVGSSSSSSSGCVSNALTSDKLLLHAARQRASQTAAEPLETNALQQVGGACPGNRIGHVVEPRPQVQVLVDREVLVEGETLRHQAERAHALHLNAAAGRLDQSGDEPEERRLARAVGTEQREELAAVDGQRQPAQRLRAAEAHRQIRGVDHRGHGVGLRDGRGRDHDFGGLARHERHLPAAVEIDLGGVHEIDPLGARLDGFGRELRGRRDLGDTRRERLARIGIDHAPARPVPGAPGRASAPE